MKLLAPEFENPVKLVLTEMTSCATQATWECSCGRTALSSAFDITLNGVPQCFKCDTVMTIIEMHELVTSEWSCPDWECRFNEPLTMGSISRYGVHVCPDHNVELSAI